MGFTGDMRQWATLPGLNLLFLLVAAGLGIAWLPDCITHEYVASGRLVPIMRRYPHLSAGAYVVRPPGQHPARKVRVLVELLIEYFARNPDVWDLDR